MSPFDLPGPQFLVFYALFSLAVLVGLWSARRLYEAGAPPQIDTTDPYLFACLRGGPAEVARVATLGLIDRGQLATVGGRVTWTAHARIDARRPRIEQAVLGHFEHDGELSSVMKDDRVLKVAAADYEDELRRHRLIPDYSISETRDRFKLIAAGGLVVVGGLKLVIAFAAGRQNVFFLIGLMLLALYLVWEIADPYRTRTGDDLLAGIRTMFSGLRRRAASIRPGSGSRDVLWLTALFGVAALPVGAFPFIGDFRDRTTASGASCAGGGTGCGGGSSGCGGGGGGCGGCGS